MSREPQQLIQQILVLRCQDGDSAAFEELIREWEQRLFYYIRRLVPLEQDAWQLLQEVWLRVFQHLGSLRDVERFPAWLFSVTRHTVMSHHRSVWLELKDVPLTEEIVTADESSDQVMDAADEVHFALGQLSLPDREILTLFFLKELSTQDIAEVLRIPRGTVKSRLFHARQQLRNVLLQQRQKND